MSVVSTPNPVDVQQCTLQLQEAFAPIFQAFRKHPQGDDLIELIDYVSRYPRPNTYRQGNSIVIRNLPTTCTIANMCNSPIINICHQAKHLFSDGDRSGKKGVAAKRKRRDQLENNSIRMCISYTYSLAKECEGDIDRQLQTMTINFLPSFAEAPKFIDYLDPTTLSSKELEELLTSGLGTQKNHKGAVVIERPMTDSEITKQLNIFIATCLEEIRNYLQTEYDEAFLQDRIPSYTQ